MTVKLETTAKGLENDPSVMLCADGYQQRVQIKRLFYDNTIKFQKYKYSPYDTLYKFVLLSLLLEEILYLYVHTLY